MSNGNHIEITAQHLLCGNSHFVVNGHDISQFVQGFVVRGRVGELTTLEVQLTSGVTLDLTGVAVREADRDAQVREINDAARAGR